MGEDIFDVVVIGAGPAGLQAAIHAVRKKATVLVIGRPGQSSIYPAHVENYLGVGGITNGEELLRVGLEQVTGFGARFAEEDVLHLVNNNSHFVVETESSRYEARSLVLATGTSRKKLKVKGEKTLFGKGVSYCVDCDANFFRRAKVAVVGNESAAVDGALTLLGYASEVTLVASKLQVVEELRRKLAASKVVVLEGSWVKEIVGETAVTGLLLDDGRNLEVEGVFIELGAKGAIALATTIGIELDMETFTHINTDKKQATNLPGVYAAGDIAGQPYQMAKAVGEGCVAGWEAANYCQRLKKSE